MARPHRRSTSLLYQSKWAVFSRWCSQRQISARKATIASVADFLLHLRQDKAMSVSAVKGFRSALAQVFHLRGIDLSTNPEISALIKNFEQEIPPRQLRLPAWDLSLVLNSLRRAPYEPLEAASFKDVTLKTVFLVALASAKRVSELHALSYVVSRKRGWSSVTLSYVPEFVAKTQSTAAGASHFELPALTNILGQTDEDALLCPVRALRRYLELTKDSRPACRRLFITPSRRSPKSVSKNSISFWIRQVVRSAYDGVSVRERDMCLVKAHEVRALATSVLFAKNCSLDAVMDAAQWRSHSTFASFYLRDYDHQYLDLHSLGPIVAAQQIA